MAQYQFIHFTRRDLFAAAVDDFFHTAGNKEIAISYAAYRSMLKYYFSDSLLLRKKMIDEYREKFANPYIAAERGFIDEVIEPRFTRSKLITALQALENKRDKNPPKKHGNIPL